MERRGREGSAALYISQSTLNVQSIEHCSSSVLQPSPTSIGCGPSESGVYSLSLQIEKKCIRRALILLS